LGRRQVVDADVRIHVQEVRAVHTVASDGGMRTAVRVPGVRRACPPCPPDCTKLPYRVGRSASGRRKVRAYHRRIARTAAILARSCWIDQEVETCPEGPSESLSARLNDLASRDQAGSITACYRGTFSTPVSHEARSWSFLSDGRRSLQLLCGTSRAGDVGRSQGSG
jgi:hypothetical protein